MNKYAPQSHYLSDETVARKFFMRKFAMFTNSSQKISTHLLTVLTISVILQLEQRKRDKEIRRLKENLLDILHTNRVQD